MKGVHGFRSASNYDGTSGQFVPDRGVAMQTSIQKDSELRAHILAGNILQSPSAVFIEKESKRGPVLRIRKSFQVREADDELRSLIQAP